MSDTFQPPADYTSREIEATKPAAADPLTSCPFYGGALAYAGERHPRLIVFQTQSNQCALITSAHSPCWMEAIEGLAPAWAECPRNPEYAADNVFRGSMSLEETAAQESATERITAALRWLNRMRDFWRGALRRGDRGGLAS